MNHHHHWTRLVLPTLLATTALAQQDFLLSFSQPERTVSGSGGTTLQWLYPNEISYYETVGNACSSVSAEKWSPRTCFHAQAGDENGDGCYWNPAIFGSIDALLSGMSNSPVAVTNQRACFYSPAVSMGDTISGTTVLRPGDVGRVVRNTFGDGQVEYLMSQEQFNTALGLPLTTVLDIDAIAFEPSLGVYFSLDSDVLAITQCGPMLIRDGAVVCIPQSLLTYTTDLRIQSVAPQSSFRLFSEADMDTIVATAQVTDRNGACVGAAGDVEALHIDTSSAVAYVPGCQGTVIPVPVLLFATESMSGASLLTTAGGGQIHIGPCGPAGTSCGFGPTFGPQMGIRATSTTLGAPSHVNAIAASRVCRYVVEPLDHVLNVSPWGAPVGSTSIDVASPELWNFMFVTFVPPTVPTSVSFPLGFYCFPDFYPLNIYWDPVLAAGGFGSMPMFFIPANTTGQVLFQSLAWVNGNLELSAPGVIDIK